MVEKKIKVYKNVFNDLIWSDSDRGVFFKRAYEYISQAENISILDKSKEGALAFIGRVQNRDTQNYDYVFKIGDYLKQIVSDNAGSETLPMFELKEYDKMTQKEIVFLLKVQGKDFEDVEYRKIFDIDKQNRPEGAENIIEIKGYGKIQREELARQYANLGGSVITDGFDVPFRFFEMPYLNTIDNKFYCLEEALSLGADISNALCCVHDERLFNVGCHGDIKIANILYDNTGVKYDPYRYILTDFNTVHHDMEHTRMTGEIGTLSTMPPEMFRGKNNEEPFYSYEVDHYSLAATMYYMLNNGIYPDPDGKTRRSSEDKTPYSYPGFGLNNYVDPRLDDSKYHVMEMLKTNHGFGKNEAIEAAEIYLFIVKQLEYDKTKRAIHSKERESSVECTRRVKHAYISFLNNLGEACLQDKTYERAVKYYGRYIGKQERELEYCRKNDARKKESEEIGKQLNLAKYNMGLALIRLKKNEDANIVKKIVQDLGDFLYEEHLEEAFEYGQYLASLQGEEDYRVLLNYLNKTGEVKELPQYVKANIDKFRISYRVKYEIEGHPELSLENRKYSMYSLPGSECVQNIDLLSNGGLPGYKVDEEHSFYPKQGELIQNEAEYVIKYVKDLEQRKKIEFTVHYQCDGIVFFSLEKETEVWIKNDLRYDESLDEIPEEFADAYSFKSANKRWGSVISNGEEIFVNCEKRYIDTEYTVKHIRDGKEVSEDTASFKSRCWAGENTRTVILTKEALQPRTYNGYEYFKILPENAAAGDILEDHAEIQLLYRKDSDAEKTVFYAVTYYKDGEECDSVIQRKRIWSGAADRLEIKSGALGAERYDGYLLDHVEPDIKEGDEISSGSLINVYYVKNSSDLDNFVIEDTTLVKYKGAEKCIMIPNGIEVIGPGAFSAHKELKGVEFPKSLKTIGNSAFINCSSLAEVKFTEGLRTIGLGAFYGCHALSSLEFPESLQTLGPRAFGDCTALEGTVYLPQPTVINEDSFDIKSSLEIVRGKQPSKATGNSVKEEKESPKAHLWTEHSALREPFVINDVTLVQYNGNEKHVVVPDGIEAIGIGAFSANKQLEGIDFPSTLKMIYPSAFANCSSLITVKFSEGLKNIGSEAFYGCSSLGVIEFPESLGYIGPKAFGKCTALKGIMYLPPSIVFHEDTFEEDGGLNIVRDKLSIKHPQEKKRKLEDKKPRNKKNIEIVTMSKPDPYSKRPQYTVKHMITDELGQAFCHSETTYAMIDWSGEMGRRIPIQKDSLNPKKINGYVFVTMVSSNEEPEEGKLVPSGTLIKLYYKKVKNGTNKGGFIKTSSEPSVEQSDIEDFTINNSTLVKYNGSEKNVVIPDGVTIIGKEAFCNCRSVESVAFPLSLKMIEARAFASCTSLRGTLELPESLLQIGRSAFYGCASIKKLDFPTRLEHIGKAAFGDCKSIKGVVLLPDSVISIGKHAFYGCDSIQLIVVPEGVQKISEQSLDVRHVVSKYEYVTKCISKDKSDIDAILAKEGRKLIETCYFVEYIKLDEDGYETCEMRKTYTGISWETNQNAPIMIRKNSLEQKKFRGYSYSETNSDKGSVSEGEYVPSGTVIKLYYKKNSFEFEYDGNTLVKYHGHESNVVIPERVTVIGREAFCKCEFIKTVKFPSSLQKIEGRAFASCSSLQGPLLLPESLVQIGRGAFYSCSSLSAVKFPTGLKYIGQAAFCECSALKGTISIPKSVISIGNNAFFGCDSIQLDRMPNDEKETDEVEKLFQQTGNNEGETKKNGIINFFKRFERS